MATNRKFLRVSKEPQDPCSFVWDDKPAVQGDFTVFGFGGVGASVHTFLGVLSWARTWEETPKHIKKQTR